MLRYLPSIKRQINSIYQDPPVGICLEVHEDPCNRQPETSGGTDLSIKRPDFVFPRDFKRGMSSFAHLTQPPVDY